MHVCDSRDNTLVLRSPTHQLLRTLMYSLDRSLTDLIRAHSTSTLTLIPSSSPEQEEEKFEKLLSIVADKAPPKILPCVKATTPCFAWAAVG